MGLGQGQGKAGQGRGLGQAVAGKRRVKAGQYGDWDRKRQGNGG